jgi:hypothetical protein
MKGKGEREGIGTGASGEKGKRQGVLGKMPFFLPPIQNRGGSQGRPRLAAGGGIPGSAAAGDRRKTERGPRGSHPRAHLGLGLLGEAAPRRGLGGGGG